MSSQPLDPDYNSLSKGKMPVSLGNKIAICCNAVVFAVTLLMALLGDETKLYPKKISAVSRKYPTDLKASRSTFKIWNAIYTFQCAWILYTITLVFRKDATEIIPVKCYVLYSFARICSTVWRLVVSRDLSTVAPFLLLLTAATSLNICLLYVLKGANDEKLDRITCNRFDLWCTRVFVPNAIVFYSMWQDIATCLSFNKMLIYDAHASRSTAATTALTVLVCIVVGWFVLENFIIERYTRFLFLEYVVLIIAASGLLKAQWKDGSGNEGYILAFLILCVLFLAARLGIIFYKEKKRLSPFIMVA